MSAVLLLAGCATTAPVQYYQLSADHEVASPPVSGSFEVVEIGIGPVTLPAYLDRPQIATRSSANQLSFADSHRWVEPLAENLSRVLAENLSRQLGTDRYQIYPWPRSRSVDWQFVVEVLQFENRSDGTAVLDVRWSIQGGTGESLLPARHSHFESPAAGAGQAERVAGLSRVLADLCQEMAAGLMQMQGRQP